MVVGVGVAIPVPVEVAIPVPVEVAIAVPVGVAAGQALSPPEPGSSP
jgi:hypothetical protein